MSANMHWSYTSGISNSTNIRVVSQAGFPGPGTSSGRSLITLSFFGLKLLVTWFHKSTNLPKKWFCVCGRTVR